ncbi:hypothetical protein V5O48_011944 [Marasmius crinis-equi]|uniref:CxC2-like cysteine cluster KDZ transposase-associated domain-containing protein n=1 Tax=Marasmius crinis-equi TaxID=585013 RepID=A0ABR3F444_9AGAR
MGRSRKVTTRASSSRRLRAPIDLIDRTLYEAGERRRQQTSRLRWYSHSQQQHAASQSQPTAVEDATLNLAGTLVQHGMDIVEGMVRNDAEDGYERDHNDYGAESDEHDDGEWNDAEEPVDPAEVNEKDISKTIYYCVKETHRRFEYRDYRTHKDRYTVEEKHWGPQIADMVAAFMDWEYRRGVPYAGVSTESLVVKAFGGYSYDVKTLTVFSEDKYQSASLVRQGYFPTSPLVHSSVVSTPLLQLFYHLTTRCPRLGIQPFIKGLCDLHGYRFKNYLCVQFSSAYDRFLDVKRSIRRLVQQALSRDTPKFRMLNCCPACQYPVEGQPTLHIRMLGCMDGNDSLKRVERREMVTDPDGPKLGELKEREDLRQVGDDYFLSQETVDDWSLAKWDVRADGTKRGDDEEDEGDEGASPCEEKWKNMNNAHTAKAWGVFDVQGWFVLLCRHSFLLLAADMYRSGEQAKYPLAILSEFLSGCEEERKALGISESDEEGYLGVGYDLGCKIVKTIARSPLNALVVREKLMMLIGILHGYAHKRLCQLVYLLIYVLGAGNENLEQCERFFSKSNALASVTRYMSSFHRKQAIVEYVHQQDNLEAFSNISKLIYGNYKEALRVLSSRHSLVQRMKEQGISDFNVFPTWLSQEMEYLKSTERVPEEETTQMEYVGVLQKLGECQSKLESARRLWKSYAGPHGTDATSKEERVVREEIETEMKLLRDAQHYEDVLKIQPGGRWRRGSEEWMGAEKLVNEAAYRKALDRLEGLVVARIFELSKMNVAGTGYKLRQHLSHALQSRSKAIENALEKYNAAASTLKRRQLKWKEVVDCTFLAEFDLLKDSRDDIRDKPWALPVNRELATAFFKLARAEETLPRLHNEIKSLVTWMKEESEYLKGMEAYYQPRYPHLAYQIRLHRLQRGRFFELHRMRLKSIQKLGGFDVRNSHFFQPGRGLKRQQLPEGVFTGHAGEQEDDEGEDSGESEGEEEENEARGRVETVLGVLNA